MREGIKAKQEAFPYNLKPFLSFFKHNWKTLEPSNPLFFSVLSFKPFFFLFFSFLLEKLQFICLNFSFLFKKVIFLIFFFFFEWVIFLN